MQNERQHFPLNESVPLTEKCRKFWVLITLIYSNLFGRNVDVIVQGVRVLHIVIGAKEHFQDPRTKT